MTFSELKLVVNCRKYAIECHKSTNHLYDGEPYEFHLKMVYQFAKKYLHLVPKKYRSYVLGACWTHDVIEDTRQTYNDVKKVCGTEIAELTFALTNEKGKTRRDRANDKYYLDMEKVPYAKFVKMCDRLANIKRSVDTASSMLGAYKKEHQSFKEKIGKFYIMFDEIEDMLKL